MTAMDTVTEISTLVLEELDFEIPCGHSAHNKGCLLYTSDAADD